MYRVSASPVAYVAMGGGIATDRITVDGAPIGFMRRGVPVAPEDSGWAFYAGDETKRYLADRSRSAVFHVNELANMDKTIVPWLYALPGAAFVRDPRAGRFTEAPESSPEPSKAGLPDGVTVVSREVTLGAGFVATLPTPFRRRVEDGSLVLWRPGLTLWIAAGATGAVPDVPADATRVERAEDDGTTRLVFERGAERPGGASVVVAYVDGQNTRALVHAYHDRPEDGEDARALLLGIRWRQGGTPE